MKLPAYVQPGHAPEWRAITTAVEVSNCGVLMSAPAELKCLFLAKRKSFDHLRATSGLPSAGDILDKAGNVSG